VSALYEKGLVHHVGYFNDLEDQMCEWIPGLTTDSPDRLDAMVYAVTEIGITNKPMRRREMIGV
jgi:phage terminase large subunit-like protein